MIIGKYCKSGCIEYNMFEKIKTLLSVFLILLLFPYIIVMLAGRGDSTRATANRSVLLTGLEGPTIQNDLLEQWIIKILPGQMPVTYELEALKSQAIILRSNLYFYMERDHVEIFEINENLLRTWEMEPYSLVELREIWGNEEFSVYIEKIHRAVEETCGKVLLYEGKAVDIPYHAVSAGHTRDGALLGAGYSYLKEVECPGEVEAEDFLTVTELKKGSLQSIDEGSSASGFLKIVSRDSSGYVTEIQVGDVKLPGEEFRRRYDLPTSCFTIQEEKEFYVITTKGLGHGFGLSMYQAQRQAAQGKNCFEILQYFYEELECISSQ